MRNRVRHDRFEDLFDDELRRRLSGAASAPADLRGALAEALLRVRNRAAPLRHAEAFGSEGAVRLRFADGTTVLVRGDGKGGLGLAAVAAVRGETVLLSELRVTQAGIHGALSWGRRHRVDFDVLGADQPD
ncbi:hypothetical protein [Tessaracoccus lapidicaptus]|uniref:hypothetical protein n=1 Tax=Tessaracoccus lapidicaptus TaxID=1427523 RepID=UPI0033408B41